MYKTAMIFLSIVSLQLADLCAMEDKISNALIAYDVQQPVYIDAIPKEILGEIFAFVFACDSRIQQRNVRLQYFFNTWSNLTAVCKKWCEQIRSNQPRFMRASCIYPANPTKHLVSLLQFRNPYANALERISLLIPFSNINQISDDGDLPLSIASRQGHLEIVKSLIKNKANVNIPDGYGDTPLLMASGYGHLDIVKLLIEHGADVNKAHNYRSAFAGNTLPYKSERLFDKLNELKQSGVDINKPSKYGFTPLLAASGQGHLEIVKLLLEHGADVNKINQDGWSPLYAATWNKHMDIMKLLIAQGAYIDVTNYQFVTALTSRYGIEEFLMPMAATKLKLKAQRALRGPALKFVDVVGTLINLR